MRKNLVNGLVWLMFGFVILGFLCLPYGLTFADEPSGKELYQKKCALCHGPDGVAKPMWAKQGAKNFNDPSWQKEMTDDAIAKVVNEGISAKKMPSYKGQLKADEIAAIIKHIRTLAPAK